MKRLFQIPGIILLFTSLSIPAFAASSFWDIDGITTAGAGGASPAGTWDGVALNWSPDFTGASASGLWTPGDTAIFSAGTDAAGVFTVTVSGTQLAAGITAEEGTVTLTGGTISFDVLGGGIIDNASSGTLVIGSVVTGGANNQTITKNGSGQLNLTGNNTHTGLTTINAGNVLIGGSGTPLGTTAGGTVVNSGGSVLHNVSATVAEPITINGTGVGGNGALRTTGARTWSGAITVGSSGALIAAGNNTFTITGAISDGAGGANNYDLSLGGSGNIRLNTGTFNIGNGIINKEGAGNIQTEAGITAGGVNLNGGGLVFRAYSGALNAAAKTITVGTASGISLGNVTFVGSAASITANNNMVNNNSALILKAANATTLTLAGQISGPGGLDIQGAGTGKVLLNNTETYTGDTKVSSGTLQLGASGSIANSANINVAGGTLDVTLVSFALGASQTLKGAGAVNGNVAVDGTLAPGNSAGTLALGSALNLNSTAQLVYELLGNNTTVGGGVNDLTTVGGNLTLDGTLNVTDLSAGSFLAAVAGDKWRLFNYTGSLTDNGLVLGSLPALTGGLDFQIDTATPGQVNLQINAVPEPRAFWLLTAGVGLLVGRRAWKQRTA